MKNSNLLLSCAEGFGPHEAKQLIKDALFSFYLFTSMQQRGN